jgi:hypothetical protein
VFFWKLVAWVHSPLELDALNVAVVAALDATAVQGVGGKRGTGNGKVRPIAAIQRNVPRPRELATTWGESTSLVVRRTEGETSALAVGEGRVPPGSIMIPHIQERAAEVQAFLRSVVA